jgi:hypothetical protein
LELDGIETDDIVNATSLIRFSEANAGTRAIIVDEYGIEGASAANYAKPLDKPDFIDGTIEQKEITIAGFAITKVYDGTTAVNGLGTLSFIGLVDGETAEVGISAVTAEYERSSIGTGIAIKFSGLFAMTGGDASLGNYAVTQPAGITGSITLAEGTPDHLIEITIETKNNEQIFEIDQSLNATDKIYYRANPNHCGMENAPIQITLTDPDAELVINGNVQEGKINTNGKRHDINLKLKPQGGLDTLVYGHRKDGVSKEYAAILITPVQFELLIKQRWNLLLVNNNPKTNGGYFFTEFKWFKNGEDINNPLQYYSAYASNAKNNEYLLNPKDVFNVDLNTEEGIKINTCYGNPLEYSESQQRAITEKKVLGINGKKAETGAKIYNSKGERSNGTTPGVYIVKEKQ